jgi:dCTP deaminase
LGSEVFVTSESSKTNLQPNEQISIPPGQFALLLTQEEVAIPDDLIGLISVKFSKKIQGLVNVSGFHVDPGFKGRLKFSVYNAGSQNIILTRGVALFPIWYSELDRPTKDIYNGNHQRQMSITDEDVRLLQGQLASPAVLKTEIDALKQKFKFYGKLVKGVIIGLIVALVIWLVSSSAGRLDRELSNPVGQSKPIQDIDPHVSPDTVSRRPQGAVESTAKESPSTKKRATK